MVNHTKVKILKISYIVFWVLALLVFYNANPLNFGFYTLGKLTGVLAISLICLQFMLSSRIGLLEKGVGHGRLMHWHSLMGKTATLFLILHPLALASSSLKFGLTISDILSGYGIYHYLGIIAFILLFVVILTAVYTSKLNINYENWKLVHKLVYVVLFLSFIHSFKLGTDLLVRNSVFYWWVFVYGVAIVSIIHRYIYIGFVFKKSIFEVIDVKVEVEGVRRIFMKPLSRNFIFMPGQYAFIRFFSKALPPEEHPFTISSSPANTTLEMTIKADGDFTSSLSKLRRGDKARIEGPYGVFTPGNAKKLFFIAGGIGITPVISILRTLDETNGKTKCKLLYSCKTKSSVTFYDYLNKLSKNKWFSVKYFLSQENHPGFASGRISKDVLAREINNWSDATFFVVGPTGMTKAVEEELLSLGVPRDRVITELFTLK